MDASSDVKLPHIASLPNFRVICGTKCTNYRKHANVIYRSSRPDHLDQTDLEKFRDLGIRCIIDFRPRSEYAKSSPKPLDEDFDIFQIKVPSGRNYKPQESVQFVQLDPVTCRNSSNKKLTMNDVEGSKFKQPHFLIDFFGPSYAWVVFNRAPWYKKLNSLLFLIFDLVFNTGYKHFVRFFVTNILNTTGLVGQYKDMVDISQRSICAALKLMCDVRNYPILINCAHGKDRTGIMSALVLACCGETQQDITRDYARSKEGTVAIKDRMHREIVLKYSMSEDFLTAKEETMEELLAYIEEKYGSVQTYLEFIGFGVGEQTKLQELLKEQNSDSSDDCPADSDLCKDEL